MFSQILSDNLARTFFLNKIPLINLKQMPYFQNDLWPARQFVFQYLKYPEKWRECIDSDVCNRKYRSNCPSLMPEVQENIEFVVANIEAIGTTHNR